MQVNADKVCDLLTLCVIGVHRRLLLFSANGFNLAHPRRKIRGDFWPPFVLEIARKKVGKK